MKLTFTYTEPPLPVLILMIVLLLVQSTWLFLDARKRDSYPWLWGIWGLISLPLPSIMYLIFVRKIFRRTRGRNDNDE
ncbi:sigmaY antisigma factor component [Paenibacillus sp. J2TS4]|uniref:sigmaY antisigma factor component n=1 Tax=Paenibacillus sp. J2TS4 TaxID=2807194 RepID=UPI001B00513A|nr:sigmaY antisigma factor component [Paenibacillus sp. J2TS4]GIP35447.1 negative regulatory protein YxlD [Paenibacillus sp. J2TS4]